MMKLEDIGFYTLCDNRAKNASIDSPLWRCEILLTDKCNFNCPYCRGMNQKGDMEYDWVEHVVSSWISQGLKNIRFSGGEPTMYYKLKDIIKYAGAHCERVAISTNGSADLDEYKELIELGVNDFSISLDSCCASGVKEMSGGVDIWDTLIDNIMEISKLTYVTVGCVFDERNYNKSFETILFASNLGVSDIRIISSAQYNQALKGLKSIPNKVLNRHPILKYRVNNFLNGRNVRGIRESDSTKCHLVKDDMAVSGKYHYPCIIYLREGGNPIGEFKSGYRKDRINWFKEHNTHKDKICSKNCLDVCIDYNNIARTKP